MIELHIDLEETQIVVETITHVLKLGSKKLASNYFKHNPPTDFEMEAAIVEVEDEIALAQKLIRKGAILFTKDTAIREMALLAGVAPEREMIFKIEMLEELFARMTSKLHFTDDLEFAATILILREFMHHLKFDHICIKG